MKNRPGLIITLLIIIIISSLAFIYLDKVMPLKQANELAMASIKTKNQLLNHYQHQTEKGSQPGNQEDSASAKLPQKADIDKFLLDFDRLLKANGITMQTMAENDKATADVKIPDHILSKSYNMTLLSGSPQKMQTLIASAEKLNRFVTIDTVNLVSQPHHVEATLDMTLYWKE